MRTTINIDEHLLAEAKLRAARQHRTIGSILEDALRALFDDESQAARPPGDRYELPRFSYANPGLAPSVDLYDKEQMADLQGSDYRKSGF